MFRIRVTRRSIPLIAISGLVLAAIGFGVWLWSVKSVNDPIDVKPVAAFAVVVSSPSCISKSGVTVIDLSLSPVVRSSVSACGQRVGAKIAVQYLAGHSEQARLAGTTVARNSANGKWLPLAIVAAGFLALVATIALLIERRQSRHTSTKSKLRLAQQRSGAGQESAGQEPAGQEPAGQEPASQEHASQLPMGQRTDEAAAAGSSTSGDDASVEPDLFMHQGPEVLRH